MFMNYHTTLKLTSTAVAVLVLSGCMSNRAMPNRVNDFSPVMPQTEISSKVVDGSIYSGGMNDGLFGDRKAYRVGDLITILLREATAASKDADSTITRTSSTDALSPLQLGKLASPGGFPLSTDSALGSTYSNVGGGEQTQNNSLGGDITVSVVNVLPNGNLVVRGEKLITLTNGDEYVQVSGVIRPDDIQPDNTILSKRIANAQITYSGDGNMNEAMKTPWLHAFLMKFMPF
jgi:flagellar L-ring protein precursor FlgH